MIYRLINDVNIRQGFIAFFVRVCNIRVMNFSDHARLQAARNIFLHLAEQLDAAICVRLWDGSVIPLGRDADPDCHVSISGAHVLGSLLRRPNLENLLRLYALGQIDFHGGSLIDFARKARQKRSRLRLGNLRKLFLLRQALPLLSAFDPGPEVSHTYGADETGLRQNARNNRDFIQFHYDLSNDFYSLFLDPEMVYSCAYFTDWDNSLEQAQLDKLQMICRKLRLREGERFLDIGCGWGALVCYAAKHYGVRAHGVTLSEKQLAFAQEKIRAMGLDERVTVELRDYMSLDGMYDKIASIGMFEHVGIANFPGYFAKISSLLPDRGILLNHGIARRAKKSKRRFRRIRQEHRWIMKHIFPGSELDHIGHTLEVMEACGFEVHDVEAWREHYALTARHWCERLTAHGDEAIRHVGRERYRLWLAYLTGVSLGFHDGHLRIYQVVASKHRKRGLSGMPATRDDLYTG